MNSPASGPLPSIAIMRPGTFTSTEGTRVSFTRADLAQIASSYDASSDPAPIVIGHPDIADPAYGWIGAMTLDGDVLMATPKEIVPAFAEVVRAGHYRKISAQLYQPGDPNSPKPAGWYLRHVGFLGAAAPAIKGLGTVGLAQSGRAVTIEGAPSVPAFGVPPGYRADADGLRQWTKIRHFQEREPHLSFAEAAAVIDAEDVIATRRRGLHSLSEHQRLAFEADIIVARARQVQAINPGCSFMDAYYIVRDASKAVSFAEGGGSFSQLFKRARELRDANSRLSFRDAYIAAEYQAKAR